MAHRPRLSAVSGEDDPLIRAVAALSDQMERIDKRLDEKEEKPKPSNGHVHVPTAWLWTLFLLALGYMVGIPAYMRAFHNDNTPPPEVILKDIEHDRRLDRHDARIQRLEQRNGGNTP